MWALQVPQQMQVPEPVTAVAAGHYHTLLLGESGDLWTCGRNSNGQLGVNLGSGAQPQHVKALAGQLCGLSALLP